jgi:flagellar hook assembly protein FlgD
MNETAHSQTELRLFANPENPSATIFFTAPRDYHGNHAGVEVYNAGGELVWQAKEPIVAGLNKSVWNAADSSGRALSSGLYIVRVSLGRKILQQVFSLVR